MSERVLVTGATGFIGKHLVDRLHAQGDDVIALVRDGRNVVSTYELRVIASTFDRHGLQTNLKGEGFDVVYHLASYGVRPGDRDPRTTLSVNVEAALILAEISASAGCKAFVWAGSSAEYAPSEGTIPFSEDALLESTRLYGATKAAAGMLLSALSAQLAMPFAGLRLFNVYGPGEAPHRLLPSIVAGLEQGIRVPLSPGHQKRDFVHVDDAVEALLVARRMLAHPGRSGVFNVATGLPTTVRDFAIMVATVAGNRADQLDFGALPMRPDEIMFVVGDPSRFNQASGWAPRLSLEEGIEQSVAHLRARA